MIPVSARKSGLSGEGGSRRGGGTGSGNINPAVIVSVVVGVLVVSAGGAYLVLKKRKTNTN